MDKAQARYNRDDQTLMFVCQIHCMYGTWCILWCMSCRVLGEVAEELRSQQATVAKQAREVEFLRQKTSQYHKLVSGLKVCLSRRQCFPKVCVLSRRN